MGLFWFHLRRKINVQKKNKELVALEMKKGVKISNANNLPKGKSFSTSISDYELLSDIGEDFDASLSTITRL